MHGSAGLVFGPGLRALCATTLALVTAVVIVHTNETAYAVRESTWSRLLFPKHADDVPDTINSLAGTLISRHMKITL